MDEWVDAPTGSGRWWRRVGDSEPVLCDVTDGEGMNATRVDGVEVLYSARPFAGVKWRRDVPAVTDETTRLHRCAKCGEERSAVESCEGDCYPLCGPCHLELRHEDAAVWRARVDAAERERDNLAAVLETRTAEHALAMARVRELEAERDAWRRTAESGAVSLADLKVLGEGAALVARGVRAEVMHLRAIIAGRTTPPTDAEIAAHEAAGCGWWLIVTENDFDYDMLDTVSRDEWVRVGAVRWCPCADDGRPCAWPAEVSR